MQLEYLTLLVVCCLLCAAAALYFGVFAQVIRQLQRMSFAVGITFVVFVIWDYIAIDRGHWYFNQRYVTGLVVLGVPVEELLFFILIPVLSILTWEIISSVLRKHQL